jgi:hypothetical protein
MVDRFAIFVDAGYLYGAGGILCHATGDRARLRLLPELPAAIATRCADHAGIAHLRTYWYDAAENLIPTVAQQEIARLPGVKLRLGRLTPDGQKGVDSLIVRDMIRLAGEHAVVSAYLLSGDEDLRTGVAEAQDYGVQVSLVGVDAPEGQTNLSIALLREADDLLRLDRAFLEPLIELQPQPEPRPGDAFAETHVSSSDSFQFGRDFGFTWIANASQPDVVAIAASRPQIPQEIDRELLRGLMERQRLDGGSVFDFDTRKSLRAGFWSAIEQVTRE